MYLIQENLLILKIFDVPGIRIFDEAALPRKTVGRLDISIFNRIYESRRCYCSDRPFY